MNEHWVQLEIADTIDVNGTRIGVPIVRVVCKCGWVSQWRAVAVGAVEAGLAHTGTAVSVFPVTGSGRAGSPE